MMYGAKDETRVEIEGLQRVDDGEAEGVSDGSLASHPAPGAARRPTGDDGVDEVLEQFDAVTDEPLDTQIEMGEQVHRVLQGRLADLGKE